MLKGTPSQIISSLFADGHPKEAAEANEGMAVIGNLFDGILEGISGGFWRFDCITWRLQWSEGLYRLMGRDPQKGITIEEFQGMIVPEDQDEAIQKIKTQFIDAGLHYQDEYRVLHADGSILYIQSVGNCIERTEDGKPKILAGFTTGIVDTKTTKELKAVNQQLQQKLKELELADIRLGVALEGVPLCLYIQNKDLEFIWAYRIAEHFGGMDALGKTDADLGFPFEQTQMVVAMKQDVIKLQQPRSFEGWIKDIHGEDRYAAIAYVPYKLLDGHWGLVGKVFDLTDHKRSEVENLKLNEDLKALTQSLEKEKQELTEALQKLSKEHKRKDNELTEARELQNSLLPSGKILIPGFRIATHAATSVEVGGDYYDFIDLPGGGLVLAVGDATGHGLRSGILVAMVKSYFQLLARDLEPDEMLDRISENLQGMRLRKMYMGLLVLKYDGNEFHLASAGMPPVLVYRKESGEVESFTQPNIFLGTHIPLKKNQLRFRMAPGDMIVAMSDGLTEAMNPEGDLISQAFIQETVRSFAPFGPERTIASLVGQQMKWIANGVLRDDTTLVALLKE